MAMPVHQTLPRALRSPVNTGKEPRTEWEWTEGEAPGKESGPVATRVQSLGTNVSPASMIRCHKDATEEGNLVLSLFWIPQVQAQALASV